MPLTVLDEPGHVCHGHKCDRCWHCQRGTCCGEAVVEAHLPPVGSWPDPPKVPVGQVRVTHEGMVCHVCGRAFRGLWKHVRTHGMNSDEYRSYFGLACGQPLAAPDLADARSEQAVAMNTATKAAKEAWDEQVERLASYRQEFTSEQRSIWATNREIRAQVNGEHSIRDYAQQGSAAWHSKRRNNPEADRKWRGRLIKARRRLLDEGVTCAVCGAQFCVVSNRAIKQQSPRKTCSSPECRREIKRRAQRASAEARKAKAPTRGG